MIKTLFYTGSTNVKKCLQFFMSDLKLFCLECFCVLDKSRPLQKGGKFKISKDVSPFRTKIGEPIFCFNFAILFFSYVM